jgi:ubiquinone/menaquinone biosynthesis C-methylase UbiE
MARVARDRLKAYPNVEIVNASFEAAQLPMATFDLVCVATALRWIAPEARFAKSHALLKASGHLAIIHRHYVSDEQGDAFTAATQPIYQRYARDAVAGARTYLPRCIGELEPEPIHEELFAAVSFDTFPQVATYPAEDDVNLLRTYSPTLAMAAAARMALLEDIQRLIEVRFAGQVCLHYAMSLQIAQRK